MVKHMSEKSVERSDSLIKSSDTKYKGVRKRKWGKWVSEIRLPHSRKRIWLGSYDSAEKAARAFDAALFCLRGCTAKFNFPNDPPIIDGGQLLSPPEIQVAAAKYANLEPSKSQSDCFSMERSMIELQVESPSTSMVSDEMIPLDGDELMLKNSLFLDLLTNTSMGLDNFAADYGVFPCFDDVHNDFFAPTMVPSVDYGQEPFDGVLAQASLLWNF